MRTWGESWPGDQINEDRYGFTDEGLMWVLDGATSLDQGIGLPAESDPSWLVDAISDGLNSARNASSLRSLLANVLQTIDQNAEAIAGGVREDFPSAAVAICRPVNKGVQFLLLGDVTLLCLDVSGHVTIHRDPQYPMPKKWQDERTVQDLSHRTSRRESVLLKAAQKRRRSRNTSDGVWIARREPEAAEYAHVGEVTDVASLGIVSDGLWRAVEPLGLISPDRLVQATPTQVEELVQRLRQLESRGRAFALRNELKASDDATILRADLLG